MADSYRITEAHIAAGVPRSTIRCPIALAIEESCGVGTFVSIGPLRLFVGEYTYCPSAKVVGWMRNFDAGKVVQPFTLTLTGARGTKEGTAKYYTRGPRWARV